LRDSIYGKWRIPDHPAIKPQLRTATTTIRHNSTPQERNSKPHRRRTRALSPLPDTDPHFQRTYGLREDTESTNNNIKNRLPNQRSRTPGKHNLTIELIGYQLLQLIKALHAHNHRTQTNTQHHFGNHPQPNAPPNTAPPQDKIRHQHHPPTQHPPKRAANRAFWLVFRVLLWGVMDTLR